MSAILQHKNWTKWAPFPDPRKKEYLFAPFGYGVYQLFNIETKQYVLFGRGKNLSSRLSSLLPSPYGNGTRNNLKKRKYMLKKLKYIKYRTIPFSNEQETKDFEKELRSSIAHVFKS